MANKKKITTTKNAKIKDVVKPIDHIELKGEKCVNITLEDYNCLRAGKNIAAYKRYEPTVVYNIVPDVKSAPQATCVNREWKKHELYNNIVGLPKHNTETDATFLDTEAPHLAVYEPTMRIKRGGEISFEYVVDTRHMKALHGYMEDGEYKVGFGDTFTLYVKDMNGKELYKKTTYAGLLRCKFKVNDFVGEGWYSVQCVDNHGRGSAIQYFNFLAEDETNDFYVMQESDLKDFGITACIRKDGVLYNLDGEKPWEIDNISAYKNKQAFTRLFKEVKEVGKNGIVLYSKKDIVYPIDYRANVGKSEIDLGVQTYKVYRVNENKTFVDLGDVVKGNTFIINGKAYTVDEEDPIKWILKDGAHLYSDDNGKVCVKWGSYDLQENEVQTTSNFLRTYSKQNSFSKDKCTLASGYYYVVDSTVPFQAGLGFKGGDNIQFPDNFTVDFNGATFKGLFCESIRVDGSIIRIVMNKNVRLKNGFVEGFFTDLDGDKWKRMMLACGSLGGGSVGESIEVVSLHASTDCVFENMDFSGAVGYDNIVRSGNNYPSNESVIMNSIPTFESVGYIDKKGNEFDLGYIHELCQDSTDRDSADSVSLVRSGFVKARQQVLVLAPSAGQYWGCGKYREMFISFYDGNKRFVKTIKTQLYYRTQVPLEVLDNVDKDGYYYVRISGYGLSKEGQFVNAAFEMLRLYRCTNRLSHNVLFKGCKWHHTRTCAITAAVCNNIVYDGCSWECIGVEPRFDDEIVQPNVKPSVWWVTNWLADLEEGWEHRGCITFKNCTAERGVYHRNENGIDIDIVGRINFQPNCARNFKMERCKGFTFNCVGMESAWFFENDFDGMTITHNWIEPKQGVLYMGNKIKTMRPVYEDDAKTKYSDNYKANGKKVRLNRCDDHVDKMLVFYDADMALSEGSHPYYSQPSRFNIRLFSGKIEGANALDSLYVENNRLKEKRVDWQTMISD